MVAALFYTKNPRIKLNPGDEVIVPAVSWSTTYYPLYQYGLKIKFVDIDLETLNYDLSQLSQAISSKTKAIVAVNLLGNPNDFSQIKKIIGGRDITLIEDNCESLGAEFEGKKAGTFGLMGTFSTFFSHHISTMEGGLIVTNDEELYHILLSLRAHGWTRNLPKENHVCGTKGDDPFEESFRFVLPGYNVRPLEMSGALGIEQVKKLYIDRDAEQEFSIFIEFTFSSTIRKILQNISEKIENLTTTQTHKRWQAALTESNIVHLYEALAPLEFEIDDTVTSHYETIKSWSKTEIDNQFLITNIIHPNFQKSITADLGIETTIDQNIINDRSMRYQYRVENPKNPGENLVEYMATRSKTKVWVDKKEHGLDEVIAGLIQLKRLPLLVVFDTVITNKYFENLEILSDALEKNNIFNRIGVYFRLANDESGKTFNQFIAEKNYNYNLTTDTQVACVSSGKLPKFFLKAAWRPMSVITLDTRMGLRHGKTAVYSNCCDLVIEYAEQPSIMEQTKLNLCR
jgi:hypothetical protein